MADSSVVVTVLGRMRPVLIPEHMDPQNIGPAVFAYDYELSRQDVRLLRLIVAGLTNDEIAEQMALAETKSVKHRIQAVYSKLGVRRRTEAVRIAGKYGLWSEESPSHEGNRPQRMP